MGGDDQKGQHFLTYICNGGKGGWLRRHSSPSIIEWHSSVGRVRSYRKSRSMGVGQFRITFSLQTFLETIWHTGKTIRCRIGKTVILLEIVKGRVKYLSL